MPLEDNAKVDTTRLNKILLQIITVSKAIGFYRGIGPDLFKHGNEKLLRNIRACLNLDDITMAVFAAAMEEYDSLPKRNPIRQAAPFDLMHSSYNYVCDFYREHKNYKIPEAA